MHTVTIIGLNGANETDKAVARLLKQSIAEANKTIKKAGQTPDTEIIHLRDSVANVYHSKHEETPAPIQRLLTKMQRADGFIFATPVHWFNVSSIMKTFIDWLTVLEARNFSLEGKVAGVLVHCREDGGNQAAVNIIGPLLHMGLLIPPYCAFYKNKHAASHRESKWQNEDHRLVGRNVVRLAECVRSQKHWD
jgi:multimeric flavodoxin WrbA